MTNVGRFSTDLTGGPAVRQVPVPPSTRRLAGSAGKVTAIVLGLGLALCGAASLVPTPTPAAADAALSESWTGIVRPIPLYTLVGTEFAKLPMTYSAERRPEGAVRRDLLTFGTLGTDTPFLKISFRRGDMPQSPVRSLVADLDGIDPAARVSVAGVTSPTSLNTRFGRFDAADLRLVDDHTSTPCIGFRSVPGPDGVLSIVGVACGTRKRPISRDLLSCVIDRIDLVSAGSDSALKTYFVDAERRRGPGCAPAPTVAAGTQKVTWLDASSAPPPLKTLSSDPRTR